MLKLVSEDPGHLGEAAPAADRAGRVAVFAVELRGPEQVRAGVTHFRGADSTGADVGQQRPALQGVVHYLSLVSHPDRVRARPERAMGCSTQRPVDASGHADISVTV